MQELINRYASEASPYLFPLIVDTQADERKQYQAALRRVNNALKEIARRAGITANLTTYVSRHSWATIAKQKKVPISVIADALGHDSETTTQVYLASIDTSTIDAANDLVLRDL